MMPTYKSMDSYPYQRNQMQYPPYYYPNIEPNPPQMNMEPPKPPFPYEQLRTYGLNYGHPMNFCCGHNNFHGCFGYRPPYHHHNAPVPSPMYYGGGGGYPAYGEQFFVPYSPQPQYSMELPRYEFDKYMPRNYHCCGCPNHPCHQNVAKGDVKIEEEESDMGKKVKDDDGALAPVEMRNYPYPVVWIPPEYTASNKEVKNDAPIGGDRMPWSPRNFRVDAEEPKLRWNGWMPIDMNRVPSSVHEGDGMRRRIQNLQGENNDMKESEDGRMSRKSRSDQKRSEYPFPIIWMPYYNKQEEENGREKSHEKFSTPKCIEEVEEANPKSDGGISKGIRSSQDESKKASNEKIIPVKEVELLQGKSDSAESGGKKEKTIPVHKVDENVSKRDSQIGREKLSTSPPRKNGKLPPVCLRVDPLPRKKNGYGSSRSPSPPASKEQSKSIIGENSKAPSCGGSYEQNDPNIGEKVKPKERTIAVSEAKTDDKAYPDSSLENVPVIIEKVEPKKSILVGEKEENNAEKGEKTMDEECGKEKKVLSDADAAVRIQAAYRGYLVRRWEPLKKLKQIDEVRKELTNVRDLVEALENSYDLESDEKQRIAIGETIMRLLLKLDTIQGLDSSLREIRKSLARELTSLQERLDSIMAKKPEQQTQEFIDTKPVEETPMNTQNEEYIQEQQEENDAVPKEDSVESIDRDTAEKVEDQSQLLVDSTPNETVDKCNPTISDVSDTNDLRELPVGIIDEDDTDDSSKDEEQNDSVSNLQDSDINPMKELPLGVIDEDTPSSEFGSKISNDVESLVELPVGVLDEDIKKPEFENQIDESETCEEDKKARNETQLEQKLVEEKEESQSSGESDEWVKIEFQKEELNKFDGLSQDIEIECEEEANKNDAEKEKSCDNEDLETVNKEKSEVCAESYGDKKLLEENEKLREMMKKLVEAGNEQMNVITDLTGRVKDLEKRLARSKRVKTKRFKPVTTSKTRSNNNAKSHDRAITVAM